MQYQRVSGGHSSSSRSGNEGRLFTIVSIACDYSLLFQHFGDLPTLLPALTLSRVSYHVQKTMMSRNNSMVRNLYNAYMIYQRTLLTLTPENLLPLGGVKLLTMA